MFLFYLFSAILLFASFQVVVNKNTVYSILYLVLAFLNGSCLMLFLDSEFLSLIFLAVYVGAIAVLFLFVVMLLQIYIYKDSSIVFQFLSLSFVFTVIMAIEFFLFFSNFSTITLLKPNSESLNTTIFYQNSLFVNWNTVFFSSYIDNITIFGVNLFTEFFFPFLIAGIVLLVSLLGSVVLSIQTQFSFRKQHVFQQISRDCKNAVFSLSFVKNR